MCEPDGAVPAGGDCSFDFLGNDDCARGNLCTAAGLGDYDPNAPIRHYECRAYCASDGDCVTAPDAPMCARIAAGISAGICLSSCVPFGADCGATGTCASRRIDIDNFTQFAVCHFAGANAAGSTCKSDVDCAADEICETVQQNPPAYVCRQLCDPAHGCPPDTTCTTSGSARVGECK